MERSSRQAAYQKLLALAETQGYVTFDNIMGCADDHLLSIQDFDWLTNAITTRGILVYSENPAMQSAEDAEYDDFAQSDYEAVYKRIIELSPSLKTFVEAVRNIVPPQYGEIKRLKYQIVDGNLHARNRMIEMHLRLALRIALGRAEGYDNDIEDTIENACIGLVNAVDKYDPDTSGAFASYASLWILQNMSREQDTQRPLMYYPVHRKEGYFTIYPLVKDRGCICCDRILSCNDIRELIREKLNCDLSDIEHIINQMIPFTSLQDVLELEESEEQEFVRDKTVKISHCRSYRIEDDVLEFIIKTQISEIIEKALNSLNPREANIIRLRYGFFGKVMTLEEVGQCYNVTRERIRQIEEKAIKKLKDRLEKSNILSP